MERNTVAIRKLEQREEVAPIEEHLGLCTTCDNMSSCVFYTANGKPVQQCEEYSISSTSKVTDSRLASAAEEAAPKEYEFKGLCMNCEKRKVCRFAKSEGGIWHCEEYV
jgi:hypothetical protein